MLKVFNSCQFVGLYAAMPYVISWLLTSPFPYSRVAIVTAVISYLIMSGILITCIYDQSGKKL